MILVTGANGQLGRELKRELPDGAIFVDRSELNITDFVACQRVIAEHGISTIINAAAYTLVDKAEVEKDMAFAINEAGPGNLAKALATDGTGMRLMVQISTDYVFSGQTHTPYVEDDATDPKSVYGRSKLAGEDAVMSHAPAAMVLRTSWLYSALGPTNFVRTMLRLGAEKEHLNVVFDQVGSPTSARHLARDITKILPLVKPATHEIYHYSDEGTASWYDFAVNIMQLAGLKCDVQPIRTSQYPTPASRPAYSVMDKTKIKTAFNLTLNHWQDAVAPCIKEIQSHEQR